MTVSLTINCHSDTARPPQPRTFTVEAIISGRKFTLRELSLEDERAIEWTRQADDSERVVAAARDLFPAGGSMPEPMTYDLAAELLRVIGEAEPHLDRVRHWCLSASRTRAAR